MKLIPNFFRVKETSRLTLSVTDFTLGLVSPF